MNREKRFKGILALAGIAAMLSTFYFPAYAIVEPGEPDLMDFLPAELIIVVVVVYCIAEFVKRTEKVPSWAVPIFVLVLAIILTVLYSAVELEMGLTCKTVVNGLIYGVIIASIAVYCNQLIKQILSKR